MIVSLSVVIPTLDAARTLEATLRSLGARAGKATTTEVATARTAAPEVGAAGAGAAEFVAAEVVVADGGSADGTRALARRLGARVVEEGPGRGAQLAAGIAASSGAWLLLLHADTRLQPGWEAAVRAHLAAAAAGGGSGRGGVEPAGYFRFALDSGDRRARRLERMVAWRCRAWSLPYGDQGLLVSRRLLDSVGGMPTLALMEDVALVRRIRRRLGPGGLVALDAAALTSAARWERDGWWRRSLRNLTCLGLWRLGVPAGMIARLYGPRGRTRP